MKNVLKKNVLKKNWQAKLATLMVAVAIWFLIDYIIKTENQGAAKPGMQVK